MCFNGRMGLYFHVDGFTLDTRDTTFRIIGQLFRDEFRNFTIRSTSTRALFVSVTLLKYFTLRDGYVRTCTKSYRNERSIVYLSIFIGERQRRANPAYLSLTKFVTECHESENMRRSREIFCADMYSQSRMNKIRIFKEKQIFSVS